MQKHFSHRHIAHHHILHAALILFAISVLLAGTLRLPSAQAALDSSNLASLSNQERAVNGKAPLTTVAILTSSAQAKVNDMIANGYFSHNAPDGTPWHQFITSTGYQYQYIGENLALTSGSDADAVNGWMNSPAHRDNLLGVTANYTEVGYGVGYAASITDQQSGITYTDVWVTAAHYGLPRYCPSGQTGIPPACTTPAPAAPPAQPVNTPQKLSEQTIPAAPVEASPPDTAQPLPESSPSEAGPAAAPTPTVAVRTETTQDVTKNRIMLSFGGITGVSSATSWVVLAVAPHKHWLSSKLAR